MRGCNYASYALTQPRPTLPARSASPRQLRYTGHAMYMSGVHQSYLVNHNESVCSVFPETLVSIIRRGVISVVLVHKHGCPADHDNVKNCLVILI